MLAKAGIHGCAGITSEAVDPRFRGTTIDAGMTTERPIFSTTAIRPKETNMGRGILLWLLGVPIPIIILLALLWH